MKMKNKVRKILAVLLSVLISAGALAGCGSKEAGSAGEDKGKSSAATAKPAPTFTYPMKTDVKIRVWTDNQASQVCTSYEELPWYQESVKRTGIQVEWIHPASNSGDLFNMMLASGDIPDVMLSQWNNFKGGPDKAISDGILLDYTDALNKYMPNLKKFFESDPEMEKICKTDTGKLYMVPQVRNRIDSQYPGTIYQGPIVRKDWLDELGMKIPQTIDDWTKMLKAFKEKKGAERPLVMQRNTPFGGAAFIGSWGILYGLYRDNGKIKFGQVEPEYREYLATMNSWYKEGLLDPDYGKVDKANEAAKIYEGKSGASYGLITGQLKTWNDYMKEKEPKFKMVAAPQPKAPNSNKPVINAYSLRLGLFPAGISANTKNIEVVARWLDWAFTEEGTITYNCGAPGISYNMENGKPKLIAEKWADANNRYYYAWWNGPYITGYDVKAEQLSSPEDKEIFSLWTTDAEKYYLPVLCFTEAEANELTDLKGEVDKYANSMFLKFITGAEPLDKFDEHVSQLRKLGLDRVLEIYQAALDRYNKR